MIVVEPMPQFAALTKDEVLAALDDPDKQNPICQELSRLIAGYTANFSEHVKRIGYIPDTILRVRPSCPIEAVAMQLTTDNIRSAFANSAP